MMNSPGSAARRAITPLLALLAAACSAGAQDQEGAPQAMPVTVARPAVQEVLDWDEYVGRFEAVEHVDIRPRASGYLQGVHFTDGQYVRRGQLLFTIDSQPARAALAQAEAQLARAQATLTNARSELDRSRVLAEQRAASIEEVEQRQAAVRTGEADVAAAQATVRARRLDLAFTRVAAPISGRVSERRVDPGNSVSADETVLTTIVSTDPLHFAFEGSEASLLKYQRQRAGTAVGTPVRVRLQDEADFTHAGRLDFVDNVLNPGAGTIRARAVVPNPTGFLRPGMFGKLRLAASQPYRALLVPDVAIVTDAARRLVYVVDARGIVAARPVELGPLVGNLRVIRSGIGPNDRVIINGVQRARPGQPVAPNAGRIESAAPEQSAPATPAAAPAAVATPVAPASR